MTIASSTWPTGSCTRGRSHLDVHRGVIANTQHMMGLLADSAARSSSSSASHRWTRPGSGARSRSSRSSRSASSRPRRWRATRPTRACSSRPCACSRAASGAAERGARVAVPGRSRRAELVLRVAQDVAPGESVRIPMGSGIAGAAARSGRPVLVEDAYQDPRFNARSTSDRLPHASVLCLPLHDRSGAVFAVTSCSTVATAHRSTRRTRSATRISPRRSACCSSRWWRWTALLRADAQCAGCSDRARVNRCAWRAVCHVAHRESVGPRAAPPRQRRCSRRPARRRDGFDAADGWYASGEQRRLRHRIAPQYTGRSAARCAG